MVIAYPLTFPDYDAINQVAVRTINAGAISRSPFTYQTQRVKYPGQRWEIDVTLRPMRRSAAEVWLAWLTSLQGQFGTFTMQVPRACLPLGSATTSRYNLLRRTQEFEHADWAKSSGGTGVNPVVTANAASAPDATTTAEKIDFDTGAGGAAADFSLLDNGAGITHLVGEPYTWSVYLRAVSGTETIQVRQAGKSAYTTCNLTTSWQRVSATEIASGSFAPMRLGAFGDVAGTGVTSIYAWGGQIEPGTVQNTYQEVAGTLGPLVKGASQTGSQLIIDAADLSATGYLKAGDHIQLGHGSLSKLHKVLSDVDTDASGNATLDIWPKLRASPADNDAVTVSGAKGLFVLASNAPQWSADQLSAYGITFAAVEAMA